MSRFWAFEYHCSFEYLLFEVEVELLIQVTSVFTKVGSVGHVVLHRQAFPLVHEDVSRALVNTAFRHFLARRVIVAEPLLGLSLTVGNIVTATKDATVADHGIHAVLHCEWVHSFLQLVSVEVKQIVVKNRVRYKGGADLPLPHAISRPCRVSPLFHLLLRVENLTVGATTPLKQTLFPLQSRMTSSIAPT